MSLPPLPGRSDTPIIQPLKPSGCPDLGSLSVMVSTQVDLTAVQREAALVKATRSPFMSRLFISDDSDRRCSVAGPMMGAPYAVAMMETLIAWGARTLLFFGWCGSVSPEIAIGDVLVATGAIIDEGTSLHYDGAMGHISEPSTEASDQLKRMLSEQRVSYREGLVWSLDAPFRETPEKVASAREMGACAVEMETSALFTVGRHHQVSVGSVLVVSDDVSTLTWKSGFKDKRFRTARRAVCRGLAGLLKD